MTACVGLLLFENRESKFKCQFKLLNSSVLNFGVFRKNKKILLYCQIHKNAKILEYCRFSFLGNWKLVKSIVRTKFRRNHVCLHSQAGNRLYQLVVWHLLSILIPFQNVLRYATIISLQKLRQVIKSNTAGFLTIQTTGNKRQLK